MIEEKTLYSDKGKCCGCGLCSVICPTDAITMEKDKEGFVYPSINKALCISCNRCINMCMFKTDRNRSRSVDFYKNTKVYAAKIKNKSKLRDSSSGGMFTAISDYVLENGGAIVCSVYSYETNRLKFCLVQDLLTRDKARGSKYIQSDLEDIFRKSEEWMELNPDKKLLFVGTGCQAAAFKRFLQLKKREQQAYIIDLICQGVMSPQLWNDYIDMQERKYHGKVEYLTFKDKRFNWKSPLAYIKIRKREIMISDVVQIMNSKFAFRPSCYNCPYTTINRATDITIGDYWGIDTKIPSFYDPLGNSLVLIHSVRGQELFDNIQNSVEWVESSVKNCLQPYLVKPVEEPIKRSDFWENYASEGIEIVLKKYGEINLINKLKLHMKRLMGTAKQLVRL